METTLSDLLTAGLLSNLPQKFTQRRADSLTKIDMVALQKQLTMRYTASYAESVVGELLNQLEFSVITGETRETDLFGWRLPVNKTIEDLLDMLEHTSFRRKQAVLVAALSDRDLSDVVSLRRRDMKAWIRSSVAPDITRAIFQSIPCYISSDLVFWESDQGRCWPMLNLESAISFNSGISWAEWKSAVQKLISK